MGVKLWLHHGKVYLSIYHNKKLWRECTGLSISSDKAMQKEIMKTAELLRSRREIQLVAQGNGLIDSSRSNILLTEYIEEMAHLKIGVSETQILKVLPYVIEHGNIKVSALSPAWYEGLKSFLLKSNRAKSSFTKSKYLSTVRQAVKKALREKLINEDITAGITGIATHESKREYLTIEEIKRMVAYEYKAGEYYVEIRPAFFFSLLTGLRISDIRMLRWGNIEADRIVKKQQKTGEYVYIPIKPVALQVIGYNADLPKDGLIFPMLASADRIDLTNRYIHKWAEKAGIKKHVSWHIARHTYATQLIESGADIYTVSKLLGHTKVETTQKYAKVTDKKKKEAVASLPDFF